VFYRRLFEIDPELRALFTSDIEQQSAKLMDMLGVMISHLERTTLLETELRLMGRRHTEYGVMPQHYDTAGRALLGMLAEMLRGDFTPEVNEAWTALYGAVADAMMAGAEPATA
jgi:hemoglobin-like flavoprotein